ncbi:hypothetical protein EDF62_3074 [Leucobacter luti]|uniref:Helicase HerA central domain-containing protein n=1 Tax=Leucobacter luti TaxID=340320 RepID=A0A4R6RTV8_9MICO|nr:DUF87 domain-containing protein [Leucobacter luti]TDP89777.1 hypothetical protein EDF62_3074 [Leucobacter luti]
MTNVGVIGRVTSVQSTTLRVSLDVGAKGFTKVGPDGLHTVGVVNSYITVPAGAHRVVAIVTGVYISRHWDKRDQKTLLSEDDQSAYELEASVVGRFEGDRFRSGLTGYPPLHAPVRAATVSEVRNIFLPQGVPSLKLGTSAVASEQDVFLDANLLLGHHCAVVGSTGSGKSCTVMSILDGLLDKSIPNGHIVIFDVNGEYAQSFSQGTARGSSTRTIVLGPKLGSSEGLFLPHWFMNNEETLSLFRASEGVQAPVLQRSIADARATSSTNQRDVIRLQIVEDTILAIEQLYLDKNGQEPAHQQLTSLHQIVSDQSQAIGPCQSQWQEMLTLVTTAIADAQISSAMWQRLTPGQKDILGQLFIALRNRVSEAFGALGMGSAEAAPDFDAPVYYSLQQLCDFFLPSRVKIEQANDSRIANYVATLQMRLSRLLADGRYDFMTRVERHSDPLGSYLKLLMGSDPTGGEDWPAADLYVKQSRRHEEGPSVTIFDLSLVASDVLEHVTSLLGRVLFDFAVRSSPRAAYPLLLVLEEAHRFIPARKDPNGSGIRSTAVFERIAKEGRKFGLSLLLASQRPSELSETVVAQCGTVIAHRLTHEADQNLLRHATALGSRALLDQLSGLAQQHALVTGVSTGVPAAVRIRDVADPPKSNDPDFISAWSDPGKLKDLPAHIDRIVEGWQGPRT